MRISDWSSDVCSSDLPHIVVLEAGAGGAERAIRPVGGGGALGAIGPVRGVEQAALPVRGLLQQVLPGNCTVVRATEVAVLDVARNRIVHALMRPSASASPTRVDK